MNTIDETRTCRRCKTTFQERIEPDDTLAWLTELCDTCLDEHNAHEALLEAIRAKERERRIAQNKIEITERIASQTPELFLRTNTAHPKFNAAAWAKIQNHKLSKEMPWIGFVGMTGRCKSRMAYLFAKNELERITDKNIPSFAFVASYEIGDAVNRQYGSDFQEKAKARDFLDRLRNVDVLLIDDLGKGRLTPAVASELFALINHRHAHLAGTIWTSNSSPESIAAGLPEDMAGPFAGRIIESSKIFTFK